jgi:hypothetical protein
MTPRLSRIIEVNLDQRPRLSSSLHGMQRATLAFTRVANKHRVLHKREWGSGNLNRCHRMSSRLARGSIPLSRIHFELLPLYLTLGAAFYDRLVTLLQGQPPPDNWREVSSPSHCASPLAQALGSILCKQLTTIHIVQRVHATRTRVYTEITGRC